jgi:hypothetical protein
MLTHPSPGRCRWHRHLDDPKLTALTAQPPGVEIAGTTAYYFLRILNQLARYAGACLSIGDVVNPSAG